MATLWHLTQVARSVQYSSKPDFRILKCSSITLVYIFFPSTIEAVEYEEMETEPEENTDFLQPPSPGLL